jgi:hypothetical protein
MAAVVDVTPEEGGMPARLLVLRECLNMMYSTEALFPVAVRELVVRGVAAVGAALLPAPNESDGAVAAVGSPFISTVEAAGADMFARLGMTLHQHNRTVFCQAATAVWFSMGDDGVSFMHMVGWSRRQSFEQVLVALFRAMQPSVVFAAAYGAKPSVEAVTEMVAWVKWAVTMSLLQFGCAAPLGHEHEHEPGTWASMKDFVAEVAAVWTAPQAAVPAAAVVPAPPAVVAAAAPAATSAAPAAASAVAAPAAAPAVVPAAASAAAAPAAAFEAMYAIPDDLLTSVGGSVSAPRAGVGASATPLTAKRKQKSKDGTTPSKKKLKRAEQQQQLLDAS